MVTKKENNSREKWALECLRCLKNAMEREDYKGKTEKAPFGVWKHCFKIIEISVGKTKYIYPLTEKEYNDYKIIEAEFWK